MSQLDKRPPAESKHCYCMIMSSCLELLQGTRQEGCTGQRPVAPVACMLDGLNTQLELAASTCIK